MPQSIIKPIDMSLVAVAGGRLRDGAARMRRGSGHADARNSATRFIGELEERMREAARKFEFEKAAQLRDRVKALKELVA